MPINRSESQQSIDYEQQKNINNHQISILVSKSKDN